MSHDIEIWHAKGAAYKILIPDLVILWYSEINIEFLRWYNSHMDSEVGGPTVTSDSIDNEARSFRGDQ